jgi:hypothetical protein
MSNMGKKSLLEKIISKEVEHILKEDYARGIPAFVLSQIASETTETLKMHLKRHIIQVSPSPAKQRELYGAANETLEEFEKELKDLLEEKLSSFLRNV